MNTKYKYIFVFLILVFIGISCRKNEEPIEGISPEKQGNSLVYEDMDTIILGKKLINPFSVEIMTKAYNNLHPGKLAQGELLKETHLYVRFAPKDIDELIILQNAELELFCHPLDYELIGNGTIYHDPEIPKGNITYQYAVVEKDYIFPQVEYKILTKGFIPGEDEKELEDEAYRIAENKTEKTKVDNYHPEVRILVRDKQSGRNDPVRDLKVRVWNFIHIETLQTDDNGYCKTSGSFKYTADVKIIFENWRCHLRNTLINILGTADRKIANEVKSINLIITPEASGVTAPSGWQILESNRDWGLTTVFNAVLEYREFCDIEGIGKPDNNLRIWVNLNGPKDSGDGSSGAAPMLKQGWYAVQWTSWWAWIHRIVTLGSEAPTLTLLQKSCPDVIISYEAITSSMRLNYLVFHELGHASHFTKVGSEYWSKVINFTLVNFIQTRSAYGNGTTVNSEYSALTEAWANHIGAQFSALKYDREGVRNFFIPDIEGFVPNVVGKDLDAYSFITDENGRSQFTHWIPEGLMNDLIDLNTDRVRISPSLHDLTTDNVEGYSNKMIFDALDSDICSPQEFRDRLLQENDNLDSEDVRDLFFYYYLGGVSKTSE